MARANPALDGVVGRMLAVDTLLRQTDSFLQSGYAADAVQLPASASADFADAGRHLDRAQRVFFLLGTAGRYQRIADNLGHAIALYTFSADDSSNHPQRGQHEASRAESFLSRAESALNLAPESTQQAALAAESATLTAVTPPPAKHPKPVHHRPAPRRGSRPSSHALIPTPGLPRTTLKVVIPTMTPSPTPAPTNTPAPTASPTPVPSPTALRHVRTRARRSLDPRVAAALHLLASGKTKLGYALKVVTSCTASVTALTTGTDSAGSDALRGCFKRALHAVAEVALSRVVHAPALRSQRSALGAATADVSLAQSKLRMAAADVEAVNLTSAQANLEAAVAALERGDRAISALERAVKHVR